MEGLREGFIWRFVDEEMNVLGHDDVAEDFKLVFRAGAFEGVEEDIF
jgi:hypothetical protein